MGKKERAGNWTKEWDFLDRAGGETGETSGWSGVGQGIGGCMGWGPGFWAGGGGGGGMGRVGGGRCFFTRFAGSRKGGGNAMGEGGGSGERGWVITVTYSGLDGAEQSRDSRGYKRLYLWSRRGNS